MSNAIAVWLTIALTAALAMGLAHWHNAPALSQASPLQRERMIGTLAATQVVLAALGVVLLWT